jgi:hypothetical protein
MAQPQARMPDGGGVYIIVNAVNMRTYVGQTANFRRREQWHKSALRYQRHTNKVLQNEWSEHGEKSFWFIPIWAPPSTKNRNLYGVETRAINAHSLDECYNLLSARERSHAKDGTKLKYLSCKLTQDEWSTFNALGGVEWLRDAIQKTRPPA